MIGLLSASPKRTSQTTVVSSVKEEQDRDGAVAASLSEQHTICPTPEKPVFLELGV